MGQGSHPLNGSLFPEFLQAKEVNRESTPGSEQGVRQEVLNVLMAQLLQERGIVAAPEQILKDPFGRRRMPDVLVDYQGLRLIIEGEFDSRTARDKASQSALNRVEEGIAHIAMALVYPAVLKSAPASVDQLKTSLSQASLDYAVVTETEAAQAQLPLPDLPGKEEAVILFEKGNLDGLEGALRRAYERLVEDRVLERAIDILNNGVGVFSSSIKSQAGVTPRFASVLGVRELPSRAKAAGGSDTEA